MRHAPWWPGDVTAVSPSLLSLVMEQQAGKLRDLSGKRSIGNISEQRDQLVSLGMGCSYISSLIPKAKKVFHFASFILLI